MTTNDLLNEISLPSIEKGFAKSLRRLTSEERQRCASTLDEGINLAIERGHRSLSLGRKLGVDAWIDEGRRLLWNAQCQIRQLEIVRRVQINLGEL